MLRCTLSLGLAEVTVSEVVVALCRSPFFACVYAHDVTGKIWGGVVGSEIWDLVRPSYCRKGYLRANIKFP